MARAGPASDVSCAAAGAGTSSAALDLFGLNFGEPRSSGPSADSLNPTNAATSSETPSTTTGKCTKESILALYQQCTPNTAGLFQSSTVGGPTPIAYGQYAGPAPPSNWAFGGTATAAADPWVNSGRSPMFMKVLKHYKHAAIVLFTCIVSLDYKTEPENSRISTNVMVIDLLELCKFPATNTMSNVPSWSDPNENWPSSSTSKSPANLFANFGAPSPASTGDRNPVSSWNVAPQPTNFGTSNIFAPTAIDTNAAAHQAYLSRGFGIRSGIMSLVALFIMVQREIFFFVPSTNGHFIVTIPSPEPVSFSATRYSGQSSTIMEAFLAYILSIVPPLVSRTTNGDEFRTSPTPLPARTRATPYNDSIRRLCTTNSQKSNCLTMFL
ncbi:hypothetical protein FGIG_09677 [Fasciola gigantica]|uniref:Uncharacterized protein n=1 Tax=Fasciola gigantica TaxID=46835 RepID=A0A504YU00_FASGI|nr:hypothetical protein FGIG_09677 [Fasciola gigantica]